MAKVCPQCNSVQPDELEFCPLDGGHLQPAPPGARVSGQHVAAPDGPDLRPVLPAAPPPEAAGSRMRRPPPGRATPDSPGSTGPGPAASSGTHRPTLLAAGVIPQLPETGGAAAPPAATTRQTSPQRRITGPVLVGRANSELTPVPVVLPPPPGVGSTLADVLRRGPMAVDQAVARIGLIAEAIAAQRQGNHGQLTPWHVQFDAADGSGRPRIGARELPLDSLYASLYRAPELELADDPAATSPSVEVYALGCILFEAIAGRAPFQAANLSELVRKHATAAAPAVRMVRRECDLPPTLELEIQRALKKRPGDRHASATAFAMAIRASNREDDRSTIALSTSQSQTLQEMMGNRAAPPAPVAAPAVGGAAAAPSKPHAAAEAPAANGTPAAAVQPPSRSFNALVAVALIAILAVGAGLLYYMQGGAQEPAAPIQPPPAPVIADVAAPAPLDAEDADSDAADADAADTDDVDVGVEVAEDVELPEISEPSKTKPKARPKATPETPKTEPKRDGPAVF